MAGKSNGRPRSYTPQDVERAIDVAEERWGKATPNEVKRVLVDDFGMKATVRPETLEAEVTRILADRERRQEEALIHQLPEPTRIAIAEAAAAMERLMSVTCGRQAAQAEAAHVARLDEESRHRLELIRRLGEIEAERDQALATAQALEAKLAAKDAVIETKTSQLTKAHKKIARLEGTLHGRKITLDAIRSAQDTAS